ncbi:hypothetical protein PRO82_001424 [Candidatus Protochlamydia amoebophila]|nr:hypothetical protein [Candidatus Protochlamydia amoebophila]
MTFRNVKDNLNCYYWRNEFNIYRLLYIIINYFLGQSQNEGVHGLQKALICDILATKCLHYVIKNPLLFYVAQFLPFLLSLLPFWVLL